jgi:hypothetical protein
VWRPDMLASLVNTRMYSLVWVIKKGDAWVKVETISTNKPYAILQSHRKKLSSTYSSGKLIIIPC